MKKEYPFLDSINTGISVENGITKFISEGEEMTWSGVVQSIAQQLKQGEDAQQELEEIRRMIPSYNPDFSVIENLKRYMDQAEEIKELHRIAHLDD